MNTLTKTVLTTAVLVTLAAAAGAAKFSFENVSYNMRREAVDTYTAEFVRCIRGAPRAEFKYFLPICDRQSRIMAGA